jgi:hypothetical protein
MQVTRAYRGNHVLVCLVVAVALLAGCAAGDPRFTTEAPAGFWQGLWHGIISMITLIVGIFSDTVRVYEIDNTGGWYDFGFLGGVVCFWGGGGAKGYHSQRSRRDRQEWEEIARKVEAKLKRMIRAWADAEPDEQWNVVEAKAEAKLRREIREWAEED